MAEAMTEFSNHMRGVNVVALYGGQRYDVQLRALRQGDRLSSRFQARLLDHRGVNLWIPQTERSGTWTKLMKCCVWALSKTLKPSWLRFRRSSDRAVRNHAGKLSRRITRRFMKDLQEVRIQFSVLTRPDISQSYWSVYGMAQKPSAGTFPGSGRF
ncbi:hypothetical protein ACNKHQ_18380 [Shigella flexneri]